MAGGGHVQLIGNVPIDTLIALAVAAVFAIVVFVFVSRWDFPEPEEVMLGEIEKVAAVAAWRKQQHEGERGNT